MIPLTLCKPQNFASAANRPMQSQLLKDLWSDRNMIRYTITITITIWCVSCYGNYNNVSYIGSVVQ